MQILLKQVKIVDPTSSLHGQIKDILIKNGRIEAIRNRISESVKSYHYPGACISPGWIDVGTYIGDPGMEQVETLESASYAGSRGGYTTLVMLPNTLPVIDTKSGIEYIRAKQTRLVTHILPMGALSRGCKGIELAELIDLHKNGAVATTDGLQSVQNPGLLLRALEYVKIFGGLILNHPSTAGIVSEGLMHEGPVSVSLGLRGFPAISEELMIKRDIDLVRYSKSRLHFLNISTAKAVELIRQAKEEGLRISASVAALNLLCTDEELLRFDANYKVIPPLRSEDDRKALLKGVRDGTIDLVTSNHRPVEPERKQLEFAYAEFGISSLETTFSTMLRALGKRTSVSRLVEIMAIRPRNILGLPIPSIERGQEAEMTLFNPDTNTHFTSLKSLSKNNPFLGRELPGRVLGIVSKGQIELAETQGTH